MGLVSKWLEGIGLSHAVPNFKAAGIVNPSDLAELEFVHYEALGVVEPSDRKKLFYLVQRIKMAVDESVDKDDEEGGDLGGSGGGQNEDNDDVEEEEETEEEEEEEYRHEEYATLDEDEIAAAAAAAATTSQEEDRYEDDNDDDFGSSSSDSSSVLPSPPPSDDEVEDEDLAGRRTTRQQQEQKQQSSNRTTTNNKDDYSSPLSSSSVPAGDENGHDDNNVEISFYSSPSSGGVEARLTKMGDGNGNAAMVGTAKAERANSSGVVKSPGSLGGPEARVRAKVKAKQAALGTSMSPTRSPIRKQTARETTAATAAATTTSRTRVPTKTTARTRASSVDDGGDGASDNGGNEYDDDSLWDELDEAETSLAGVTSDKNKNKTNFEQWQKQQQQDMKPKRTNASSAVPSSRGPALGVGADKKAPRKSLMAKQSSLPTLTRSRHADGDADNERESGGVGRLHRSSSAALTNEEKRKKRMSAPAPGFVASSSKLASTNRRRSTGVSAASGRTTTSKRSESDDSDCPSSSRRSSASGGSNTRPPSATAGGSRPRSATSRDRPSRLPSPTKRRIGTKGLSTIPSERTAPMSPLVTMSSLELEESIGAQRVSADVDEYYDDEEEAEEPAAAAAIKGRPRSRSNSAGRRSLSSSSRERESSLPKKKGADRHRRVSAPLEQVSRSRANSSSDVSDHSQQSPKRTDKAPKKRRETFGVASAAPRSRSGSNSSRRSLGVGRRDTATSSVSASSSPKRSRSPVPNGTAGANTSADPNDSATTASTSGAVFVHGMPEDKSWATQVARLREDNANEHEILMGSSLLPHGPSDDDDEMRIRVVVRKRPMSRSEASRKDDVDVIHPLEYDGYARVLVYQPKTRVDLTREVETLPFAFDNGFDESSNNVDIYERTVQSLVPGVFEGKFCNVFAYGQTGSGKTFTMMGSNMTGAKAGNQDTSNMGLYYLAAQDVFYLANVDEFRHLTVGASLFEIYGGKLFDLLNGRQPIKCLEDHRGKVCFPGLSEHPVSSAPQLMDIIEAGAANRSTGTTSANADSSRSHAVLQLSLRKNVGRKKGVEHGRLTFIDLAGSERGADTSQASRTTRLEGAEINTSLLALKEVIRALATGDSMKHIPFRGSKLTQVLKESFVGKNSRTVMVACVAPNIMNVEHTINTLRYADRVKERDAETGNVTAAVASGSRIRIKKAEAVVPTRQRPATAPASSFDLCRENSVASLSTADAPDDDDDDDDEYSFDGSTHDPVDRDEGLMDDAEEVEEADQSGDSFILEKLLNGDGDGDSDDEKVPSTSKNRETAQSLIETHRSVMSEMLGMVKREMTLVNSADADRDSIEEYLLELEDAQEKQLSMISTLRESLLEYYASRSSSTGENNAGAKYATHVLDEFSDDSDDLRD